jgi:hypothetical protein
MNDVLLPPHITCPVSPSPYLCGSLVQTWRIKAAWGFPKWKLNLRPPFSVKMQTVSLTQDIHNSSERLVRGSKYLSFLWASWTMWWLTSYGHWMAPQPPRVPYPWYGPRSRPINFALREGMWSMSCKMAQNRCSVVLLWSLLLSGLWLSPWKSNQAWSGNLIIDVGKREKSGGKTEEGEHSQELGD